MKENTESIKVGSNCLRKVRRHVKKTKQSIGGFYDLAAKEKLDREIGTATDSLINSVPKMEEHDVISPPQKAFLKYGNI